MQGKWGETRPDLIITGFGAFPGMRDNPSARLVKRLAQEGCFARRGWRVDTRLFPVAYGEARSNIADCLASHPRVLLMFGVAGKARKIRMEMLGLNRASPVHRDASGALPAPVLQQGSPAKLHAKPAGLAVAGLVARNKTIIISRNAGRYLCNALLYHALDQCTGDSIALFVHIPKLRMPQAKRGDPRPDLSRLTRIGRDIATQLVKAQRFRQ